jgi:hypothetical protein
MQTHKTTLIGGRIAVMVMVMVTLGAGLLLLGASGAAAETDQPNLTESEVQLTNVEDGEEINIALEWNTTGNASSTNGNATVTLEYAEGKTLNTSDGGTISVAALEIHEQIEMDVSGLNQSELPYWTETTYTVSYGDNTTVTEPVNMTVSLTGDTGNITQTNVDRGGGGLLDGGIAGVFEDTSMTALVAVAAVVVGLLYAMREGDR